MAAKESQGLQIALIIFALLTVTLGITTYVFFDKYELETTKALAAQQKEQQSTKERDAAVADFNTLKTEIVGAASTHDLEAINTKLEQLRNKVHPSKKSANPSTLIPLNIYSYQSAFKANKTMLKVQDQNVELQNQIERLQEIEAKKREVTEKETQGHLARAAKIEAKYLSETAKLSAASSALLKRQRSSDQTLADRELQSLAEIGKLRVEILSKEKRIADLNEIIDRLRARKGNPEKPDGLITRVNQKLKLVYINRGSEDGVRKGLLFKVYADKGQQIDEANIKAQIEVTQITGVHRAEARIIKSQIDDPILTNDHIYNKNWKPGGQPNGYALVGWMDIDGDGRSDRNQVKSLIRKNGGVFVAEVDDDGNLIGKISTKTDFLILGEEPKLNRKAMQGFTSFQAEAKKLRVPILRLDELLDNLDYKGRRKPPRKELTFRKGT